MAWQLQEAKQRFSQLVDTALREGPQVVTRHGEDVVVVVPIEEYKRLTKKEPDFVEFLLSGPSFEDLELDRSEERARDIEL